MSCEGQTFWTESVHVERINHRALYHTVFSGSYAVVHHCPNSYGRSTAGARQARKSSICVDACRQRSGQSAVNKRPYARTPGLHSHISFSSLITGLAIIYTATALVTVKSDMRVSRVWRSYLVCSIWYCGRSFIISHRASWTRHSELSDTYSDLEIVFSSSHLESREQRITS